MREIKLRGTTKMREIKFRIYSPIENKMHKPVVWQDFNPNNYLIGDIIQQYTGLKDKNGVEIYEGDIMDNLQVVKIDYIDTLEEGCIFGVHTGLSKRKVIGNIYENKELLK